MSQQYDLVVVANRLPVERNGDRWETSPGGLVRAIVPVLQERHGAWVGWPGGTAEVAPFEHDGLRLEPVALSERELEGFYAGFSNETLWPLYHDAIRPSKFDPDWWRCYQEVNERFARAAAEVAAPGALVWVHDYHLQLLPAMLRALRPDVLIGFFLHIPFPPIELFRRLPWREELLEGLAAADVLGFQRRTGVENFARCAIELLGAGGLPPVLTVAGRRIHVAAHPISIDFRQFEQLAHRPEVQARAQAIRAELGNPRRVLLGVDRLDYTKGIDRRLEVVGRLFEHGHLDPAEHVMVQVATPTRGGVNHYDAERERVERLVSAINGRVGGLGHVAVRYLHRSLPLDELVALYQAADVMLVTPFKDGMNLVAKEYVASRVDGNGVLVLSEFAGAADELHESLLVNPHDEHGTAQAIVRAASMNVLEVRRRMAALRRSVASNDVNRWASRFLAQLERVRLARAA